MTTSSDSSRFNSPAELLLDYAERLAAHGAVQVLRLFCRADRPEQLLCMAQMDGDAGNAVVHFPRSFVTGNDLCTFVEVPRHFTCENRVDGRMSVPTCSECRKHVGDPHPAPGPTRSNAGRP